MALGFEDALPAGADAIQHVMHVERSVELTTLINFFMLPGFVAGLLLMRRMSHVKMQTWGFIICALGLILLLMAYENHWNMMWAVAGFCIFEALPQRRPSPDYVCAAESDLPRQRPQPGFGSGLLPGQSRRRVGCLLHTHAAECRRCAIGAVGEHRRDALRRPAHSCLRPPSDACSEVDSKQIKQVYNRKIE